MGQGGLKFACLLATVTTCLATLGAGGVKPVGASAPSSSVPGELLVRFEPGVASAERAEIRREVGATVEETLPVPGLQLLEVAAGQTTAAEARLEQKDGVVYAEPNVYRQLARSPNDPQFTRLWGLSNTGQAVAGAAGTADADIDAPEAWDVTIGDPRVTVAVVDSGVEASHPDLASSAWTNPGESGPGREANGRDDDANGFIDDVRGWDWVEQDAIPQDANGHGTHVAGTIGARGDDRVGVAGVSWQTRVMSLRVLDAKGSGTLSNVIAAYGYAARKRAAIVNASLGGTTFSRAEYDLLRGAPGVLFVAAAGNDGADTDTVPQYPCAYDLANVICVAASDQRDALASFSNYGAGSVDLAAPGTSILSDQPGGGYAYYNGTSMAAPHVSGVAALVFAHDPAVTVARARAAILSSVDPVPALRGKTVSGGRLNAAAALGLAPGPPPPPPAAPGPAPTPGTATPPPRTVPRVALRVTRHQRLGAVLRRGVRVRVSCSRRCRLTTQLVLRRLRSMATALHRGARSAIRGRRSTILRGGRSAVVSIRLSRGGRRALRAAGRARITVVARAASGASVARAVRRTVVVRR